jgi:hypothetical protein
MDQDRIHIHKRSKYENCVLTGNEMAQDSRLTWAARGLLLYMLSLPADWNLREDHLVRQSPKGRDHLRGLLCELEQYGYLFRKLERNKAGQVVRSDWTVWGEAQESPALDDPSPENPSAALPATENPAYYKDNTLTKTTLLQNKPPLTPRGGKPAAAGPAPLAPPPSASAPEPPPVASQIAPEPLPAPPAPSAPPKRVRDPLAGRALPPDAIPADLQHVGQLLTEWWEVKSRGRTTTAFRRACEMLRGFPPQQQQRMLQSAVVGGWQGLHEVEPKPTAGRFMSRQERQEQAVENVINFLAVADPSYAAPSHPQHPANMPARPGDHAIPITDYGFLDHA